jgi:hypothetical protein
VRHQLAHAKEKMGNIDLCLAQWDENLKVALDVAKEERGYGPGGPNTDAARHNLYITARRRNERLAAVALRENRRADAERLWRANVKLAEDWMRQFPGDKMVQSDLNRARARVEEVAAGKALAPKPHNIEMRFTVTRIQPRLLEIKGNVNVLDLSRLNIVFRDKGYEERIQRGFDFKMNNCSLEWDNVSIRNGKFNWQLRLNRDPADMGREPAEIYPLKADEFELVFTYNPRYQAAFIQDVYGWNGEGLTSDPKYLRQDDSRAGVIDGQRYPLRYVTTSVTLTKDDILGKGKKLLFTQ